MVHVSTEVRLFVVVCAVAWLVSMITPCDATDPHDVGSEGTPTKR